MCGKPTKKTHHPHTGIRWPFCPERFSHKTRSLLASANPLGFARSEYCDYHRRRLLARLEKQTKMVRKGETR